MAKAQLFLTVHIDDLKNEVKAGTTVGGADAGTVLAPQTVRRIACDAGLLPTVMNGPGQVLDLGTTTRCFTPAQTKALWLRDHACTMPGCGMPAQWCDAHHLVHWGDGGGTDLDRDFLDLLGNAPHCVRTGQGGRSLGVLRDQQLHVRRLFGSRRTMIHST